MSEHQPRPTWGEFNKPLRQMVVFAVSVGVFIVTIALLLETNCPMM
jgi:hypothetical protein